VQLKDARGHDSAKDGVEVNLTASGGTLRRANLTTVKGRARTNINSDVVGTVLITASSSGLIQAHVFDRKTGADSPYFWTVAAQRR